MGPSVANRRKSATLRPNISVPTLRPIVRHVNRGTPGAFAYLTGAHDCAVTEGSSMRNRRRLSRLCGAFTTGLALLIAGCGGGDDGGGMGTVSLSVTDAPVDDAQSVVVQFRGVAFKREGDSPETIETLNPSPRQIDLLQFQEGRAALLLDGVTMPAGRYQWIRLIVDNEPNVRDSYITLESGAECELRVPSGAESGLKLNRGFTLEAEGSVALTVDFALHQSIYAPPSQLGTGVDCGDTSSA